MKTPNVVKCAGLLISLCAGAAMAQPRSFHLMQIEQVIGGVDGDPTRQAVQLRMRSSFQNLMSFSRLRVQDATGGNTVLLIDMTTDVPNFNTGDRVLIATAGFAAATSPACVPDFIMTSPIPPSYLAAGRLLFEDDAGTILWSLAWGGAAYTGSNTGALTNDANGNFGPPFGGPCPSTSLQAVRFTGAATAPSTTNLADYALTPGAAVFTNNARAAFTVISTTPPCYPNCDGSSGNPLLTANDFQCFLNEFAAGDTYANCDGSTGSPSLTANDFQCFLNKFAAGCS